MRRRIVPLAIVTWALLLVLDRIFIVPLPDDVTLRQSARQLMPMLATGMLFVAATTTAFGVALRGGELSFPARVVLIIHHALVGLGLEFGRLAWRLFKSMN